MISLTINQNTSYKQTKTLNKAPNNIVYQLLLLAFHGGCIQLFVGTQHVWTGLLASLIAHMTQGTRTNSKIRPNTNIAPIHQLAPSAGSFRKWNIQKRKKIFIKKMGQSLKSSVSIQPYGLYSKSSPSLIYWTEFNEK